MLYFIFAKIAWLIYSVLSLKKKILSTKPAKREESPNAVHVDENEFVEYAWARMQLLVFEMIKAENEARDESNVAIDDTHNVCKLYYFCLYEYNTESNQFYSLWIGWDGMACILSILFISLEREREREKKNHTLSKSSKLHWKLPYFIIKLMRRWRPIDSINSFKVISKRRYHVWRTYRIHTLYFID